MKIYLVRHGEALPSEINPEKPLSPEGSEKVEKIARFLAKHSFPIGRILHSEKLRAKETAEIFGRYVAPDTPIEEHSHLNPNDDIDPIASLVEAKDEELMLVGHLPFMSRLLGQLLTGNEDRAFVDFQAGTVVCLEAVNGNWIIRWVFGLDLI